VKLDKLLADSPEASAAFKKSLDDRGATLVDQYGRKMIDSSLALAKKLGPAGKDIERSLTDLTKTNQERTEIALKFLTDIDPQNAVAKFKGTQPSTLGLAADAMGRLPKDSYEAVLKHKISYLGAVAGVETMIHGHPGVWSAGGAAVAAVTLPGVAIKNGFITALRNPQTAVDFVKAVNSGALDQIANVIADSAVASGIEQSQKDQTK